MSANRQIKAAHARNLAVQRSRLASMPEVGIFWLIDNKLVADSIPWPQADIHGGFHSGKNDHATFWATLQRLMPQWKGNEYTDFPRGRVLFDSKEEVFVVYSSREIVNSQGLKKMILAEFNLPMAATKFAADSHYENAIPPLLDTRTRYLPCSTRTLTEAMPKIDVNQLQRVLQFQAERRRGRLAIIVLLHARVDQLCGWNRISRVLN